MVGPVTEKPFKAHGVGRVRWELVRAGTGRVCRWFVCSVVLAAAPILVSFLALPRTSTISSLLSHGDFAVLASALAAASLGELIGPSEPPRWIRNILIMACILIFTCAVLLLAGIAGRFARLSPPLDVRFSWLTFLLAALIGAGSWAATADRAAGDGDVLDNYEKAGQEAGG